MRTANPCIERAGSAGGVSAAPAIRISTLLLRAEHDEVIPRASTERLHAAFANGVASLVVIPGAGHDTISNAAQYLDSIRAAL